MSSQVNTSDILRVLFREATEVVPGRPSLTDARFLLVLIKALQSGEELSAELLKCKYMLDVRGANYEVWSALLRDAILHPGERPYLDNLYMSRCLLQLEEKGGKKKNFILTADALLNEMLHRPGRGLQRCMAWKAGDALPDGADGEISTEADPEKALADARFDQLFAREMSRRSDPKWKITELTERVTDLREKLSAKIFGQENAVSVFAEGFFRAELQRMVDPDLRRPASFLFAGPPGVGKTLLAKTVETITGIKCRAFNMSEYADQYAAHEFIGSDGTFKDAKEGLFTQFIKENPRCIVVLDEIEKAHISIIHLFLQILDAGEIRDSNTDETLYLRDVILIFTTNAGRGLYESNESGDFSTVPRKVVLKALQDDVNPTTGQPYFPAAICSRFASGNVVMFNRMDAWNLHRIARENLLRQADRLRSKLGIRISVDPEVYTSLLFAEGGSADARTVGSRAEAFLMEELHELFRLTESELTDCHIRDLESIRISVNTGREKEIDELFHAPEKAGILTFVSDKMARKLPGGEAYELQFVSALSKAKAALKNREFAALLLDPCLGVRDDRRSLNPEDADSEARDLLRYTRIQYPDLPVYLLQADRSLVREEEVSYLRLGVRGVVSFLDGPKAFGEKLTEICRELHLQKSLIRLTRSSKVVSYETDQDLTCGGKEARIRLFDFKLSTALDAEDSESVLGGISRPDVTFDEIIGAEDAKDELKFFVSFLKNPKKTQVAGLRPPKGILLYGPPGTGKTLLAKAMANASDVTFLSAEGNQFLKPLEGQGPEHVREIFRTARKYAPAVLFIDEIDAIGKERRGRDSGSSEEILTAFLTEMDGFRADPSKPVFVLAATNFDVEAGGAKSLDPALVRRFDRRIFVDLPTRADRIRFMKKKIDGHKAVMKISQQGLENLAVRSVGMSLADLDSVFELSLRTALRLGKKKVEDDSLDEAFESYRSGDVRHWDAAQLTRVARHEAGHALMCLLTGETPSYLTVVPRGDHGGYMQHGDQEGKAIYTRKELLDSICISLAGRAAETVCYGPEDGLSTGAAGDLVAATRTAKQILCSFGMEGELAVWDTAVDLKDPAVRTAVNGILSRQLNRAEEEIGRRRAVLDRLVEELLDKNHLTAGEIEEIFRSAR